MISRQSSINYLALETWLVRNHRRMWNSDKTYTLWTFIVPRGFADLYKYHPYTNMTSAITSIAIPNGTAKVASTNATKPNRTTSPNNPTRTANTQSNMPPMKLPNPNIFSPKSLYFPF